MADYYTYVAADIKLPAEILDTFAKLAEYIEDEDVELDFKLDKDDKRLLDSHERGWASLWYERTDDGIWITDDGCGSIYIDELATCFHLALRVHNSKECVAFDWANGCSKHRADAFGGGAVFITKDTIDSITTYDWMRRRREQQKVLDALKEDKN